MRILFQYLSGGGGGLSNLAVMLRALAKRYPKDQVDVVCSASSGLLCLDDIENVTVIPLGGGWHPELDRLSLALRGLGRLARERESDVIWSMNLGPYLRTGIPQVLSMHNSHQVYPWRSTRSHPGSRARVAALRWFFRRSLRVSDGVIVQTGLIREHIRRIPGAPERIAVIPKSVETGKGAVAAPLPQEIRGALREGPAGPAATFLYVATAAPHKNHGVLIEAFRRLESAGERVRLVLTLGRDELSEVGGETAERLIRQGILLPVGWVPGERLGGLYDACDFCLMPSLLESLSSAHLEAMQWGKPQVVADRPYSADLCGEAALYADPSDAGQWVEQVRRLIRDPALGNRLAAAGRERMKTYPETWDDVAGMVREFLEETARAEPTGRGTQRRKS